MYRMAVLALCVPNKDSTEAPLDVGKCVMVSFRSRSRSRLVSFSFLELTGWILRLCTCRWLLCESMSSLVRWGRFAQAHAHVSLRFIFRFFSHDLAEAQYVPVFLSSSTGFV